MNIEKDIEDILFEIGKEIKIHRLDNNNIILDLDYNKYVKELLAVFKKYNQPAEDPQNAV